MQQNNYIEAEDAYRRALSIAPDNNKMCNLGICLMKQGRISEAKETLCRVKPAVADGPRGSDSHLKAYERAQQMLKDLESEMLNKGGVDRVEQSRIFEAFLGSSSIWQPQPCKDHTNTNANSVKTHDDFADENMNSNIVPNYIVPQQKGGIKQQVGAPFGNSLNIAAPPFYVSKSLNKEPKLLREQTVNHHHHQFTESLKRTRSENAAGSMRVIQEINNRLQKEPGVPENKTRRLSSEEGDGDKLKDLLPDNEDFEDAILAAILGPTEESEKGIDSSTSGIFQRKIDKRLKVFQDITLSLSPRARA